MTFVLIAKQHTALSSQFFSADSARAHRALRYLLKRLPSLLGFPKREWGYAMVGAPFESAHQSSITKGQPDIRSHVVDLLLFCGPAAVARLVVTTRVNPVEGISCFGLWAVPHILNKAFNAAFPILTKPPTVANLNSSPSVEAEFRILWVMAAPLGVLQGRILRRSAHPVAGGAGNVRLDTPAPTGLCSTLTEIGPRRSGQISAGALALPNAAIGPALSDPYRRESTENLARQILRSLVHGAWYTENTAHGLDKSWGAA